MTCLRKVVGFREARHIPPGGWPCRVMLEVDGRLLMQPRGGGGPPVLATEQAPPVGAPISELPPQQPQAGPPGSSPQNPGGAACEQGAQQGAGEPAPEGAGSPDLQPAVFTTALRVQVSTPVIA